LPIAPKGGGVRKCLFVVGNGPYRRGPEVTNPRKWDMYPPSFWGKGDQGKLECSETSRNAEKHNGSWMEGKKKVLKRSPEGGRAGFFIILKKRGVSYPPGGRRGERCQPPNPRVYVHGGDKSNTDTPGGNEKKCRCFWSSAESKGVGGPFTGHNRTEMSKGNRHHHAVVTHYKEPSGKGGFAGMELQIRTEDAGLSGDNFEGIQTRNPKEDESVLPT